MHTAREAISELVATAKTGSLHQHTEADSAYCTANPWNPPARYVFHCNPDDTIGVDIYTTDPDNPTEYHDLGAAAGLYHLLTRLNEANQ